MVWVIGEVGLNNNTPRSKEIGVKSYLNFHESYHLKVWELL